jgi:TonB family protein
MLKSPPPAPTVRLLGVTAAAGLSLVGACAAWAAQPGAPRPAGGLEPEAARKMAGQDGQIICKPDANRELHNCRVVQGSPWTKIATTADVRREYPPQALLARLTADVLLRCRPDRASGRLEDCRATSVEGPAGQAIPPAMREAFGAAAVRVAGAYRLRNGGDFADFKMPDPMYMVIQFKEHPVMPGGPPANPAPTHAPSGLPIPAKVGQADAKTVPIRVAGPAAAPPLITKPAWIEKPTAADMARLYPAEAARLGVAGRATMACTIAADGRLANCEIVEAAADGDGPSALDKEFGGATLQMAKLFRMEAVSRDGVRVAGGSVKIPVLWRLPQTAAPR